MVLCLPEVFHVRSYSVAAFSFCLQADLGACPFVYVVPYWSGGVHFRKLMVLVSTEVLWVWLVLFSALWSVFKQAQGACTLDVSLRLVCSGLKLARGFLQVNLFFWVDWLLWGLFLNRPRVLVPLMLVLRLVCSGLKLARGSCKPTSFLGGVAWLWLAAF